VRIDSYLNQTLLFGALRSGTLIGEKLTALFRPANLNYIQALILIAISREKSLVRPKDLQNAFRLSSGAVSQSITHLEKIKYLERKIADHDARGYQLHLTARGRTLANRLINRVESLERDIGKVIGIQNSANCLQTLQNLQAIIKQS
jgi:DNA-binding MarR family transcriptional regulator